MPFLNVALTSQISARITIVGLSKFSHCADGNPTRKIWLSWPEKFCNSKSGVFLGWWACQSMTGYTGEEMLRDCTYGKKARLTWMKDESWLSLLWLMNKRKINCLYLCSVLSKVYLFVRQSSNSVSSSSQCSVQETLRVPIARYCLRSSSFEFK